MDVVGKRYVNFFIISTFRPFLHYKLSKQHEPKMKLPQGRLQIASLILGDASLFKDSLLINIKLSHKLAFFGGGGEKRIIISYETYELNVSLIKL